MEPLEHRTFGSALRIMAADVAAYRLEPFLLGVEESHRFGPQRPADRKNEACYGDGDLIEPAARKEA
jgi:hypothetical protein